MDLTLVEKQTRNLSVKINIGCGWRNFGEEWTHIDGGDYSHLDHSDIFLKDYSDNSVDLIYSSHMIEYFDREEIIVLLEQWHRVLKPNGTLRIAVPDFTSMVELYTSDQIGLTNILGPLYGKMEMGDEVIYHKTVYDFWDLSEVLTYCGFKDVRKYDWTETEHSEFDDHSQAYIPHMDKENGTLISLNVEATK